MIKGFIFDLDGVIVDTAKYHYLAWKELANSINIDFTETENEQLKGVSRAESLQRILNWGNVELSETKFNRMMSDKNKIYLDYINGMDETDILPDVPRVLNFLKTHKQLIALGSASKNAKYILKKLDLFDEFHVIIDGASVTNPKPDPEVFLTAAEKLHVSPIDCFVFEDAEAGIEAANAAHMKTIGIGDPKILSKANKIFSDFTQIPNVYLKNLIYK